MYISFTRSGGVAGIPVKADLDTASLPSQEAEAIEQMLAEINFFDLPGDRQATADADRFQFELTVIDEEVTHTVCFTDQGSPPEINTLLRHLTILARRPAKKEPTAGDEPE